MYDISIEVLPKKILKNQQIIFDWDEPAKTIEINFQQLTEVATYVTIYEYFVGVSMFLQEHFTTILIHKNTSE